MLGLNGPSSKDFSGAHLKQKGMRFAMRMNSKIAVGVTEASKETHKSNICSANKDTKIG